MEQERVNTMTNDIRPIDANALALKISEYMVDFPKRSERMFTCMHILSMLEDEDQTQTLAGFVPDYNVEPTARIDREKWTACEYCHTCSTCKHDTGDWERDPCYDCGHYKNWELGVRFCPRCGRPLTPEAWKELDARLMPLPEPPKEG